MRPRNLFKNYNLIQILLIYLLTTDYGFAQINDHPFIVQPTAALNLNKQDLATELLLNIEQNNLPGSRYLNIKSELPSTKARTWIQNGITTEYATEILGTTVDNGRLYAKILRKSSRRFGGSNIDEPNNPGIVKTSIIGVEEPQHQTRLFTVHAANQRSNSNWYDDDNFIKVVQSPKFNRLDEFGGDGNRSSNNFGRIQNENLSIVSSSSSTSGGVVGPQAEVKNINVSKVVSSNGDLPTFTIKNMFSPSGHLGDQREDTADKFLSPEQRSGRNLYSFSQNEFNTAITNKNLLKSIDKNLHTVTYYGFDDFTTIVGETVFIFSPSTKKYLNLINPTKITTIKVAATLDASSVSFSNKQPENNDVRPTFMYKNSQIIEVQSPIESEIQPSQSILEETDIETEKMKESLPTETMESEKMLSRPSDEDIQKILASLASANAEKESESKLAEADSKLEEVELKTSQSVEESPKEMKTVSNDVEIKTSGGATTIFFEIDNDPFYSPETMTKILNDTKSTAIQNNEETILPETENTLQNQKATDTVEEQKIIEDTTSLNQLNTIKENCKNAIDNNEDTAKSNCEIMPTESITEIVETISQISGDQIETAEEPDDTIHLIQPHSTTIHLIDSTVLSINEDVNDMEEEKIPDDLEHENVSENIENEKLNIQTKGKGRQLVFDKSEDTKLQTEPIVHVTTTESSLENSDSEQEREIELIYKTLYTTYTYLTTFFHNTTSSISSHTEIMTNIETATIQPTETVKSDNSLASTSDHSNKLKYDFHEIDDIIRRDNSDLDTLTDLQVINQNLEKSTQIEGSLKTLYTTYTYYTTIFVNSGTEVMSRTEVHTNYVENPTEINPSATLKTNLIETSEKLLLENENNEENNVVLRYEEDLSQTENDIPVNVEKKLPKIVKYSTLKRKNFESQDESKKDSEKVIILTDVKSSTSGGGSRGFYIDEQGEEHFLTETSSNGTSLGGKNPQFEDQISSESNIDVILPSPRLLLQTSFTTFTYYTTLYQGAKTNVISRLETITNYVTETMKTEMTETSAVDLQTQNSLTLPITYFTTFTYWTTLAKDDQITTISRKSTISNVISPMATQSASSGTVLGTVLETTSSVGPESIETTESSLETEIISKQQTMKLENKISNEYTILNEAEKIGELRDALNISATRTNELEPETYFTTYTYYTTLYQDDETILQSRLETVKNIVTPNVTLDVASKIQVKPVNSQDQIVNTETFVAGAHIDIDAESSSNKTPELNSENQLSVDIKTLIDAEGISTIFYTTKLYKTEIDGTEDQKIFATSSTYVDEIKKALLPANYVKDKYPTGLVRIINGTQIQNQTTTLYQSKVIGTLIDGRYAQIIESTSSFIVEKSFENILRENSASPVTSEIKPTRAESFENVKNTASNPSLDMINSLIQTNSAEAEDFDDTDEDSKSRPFATRKRPFSPVIRPFASRNRPQFAPKRKSFAPNGATIITRTDLTPTITATPANAQSGSNSRGRYSGGNRKSGSAVLSSASGSPQSSRKFYRASKSPGLSASISPSSGRNKYAGSSGRIEPSSPFSTGSAYRGSGGVLRGSSSRQFSSIYAGNSRIRIKPSSALPKSNLESTQSPGSGAEFNTERNGNVDDLNEANDKSESEVTTQSSNPLLKFRRPGLGRSNLFLGRNSTLGSTQRKPLTSSKPATTTTTSKPRTFQRGGVRPPSSIFPPRGRFQPQNKEAERKKANENDATESSNIGVGDQYDEDEEDEDGYEKRKRRNNVKLPNPTLKQFQNRKKRETSEFGTRSNFRNRFRRPTQRVAEEGNVNFVDEEKEQQPQVVPRPRTTLSRYNSKAAKTNPPEQKPQQYAAQTSLTTNRIRPTKAQQQQNSGRQQFTLRAGDKDVKSPSRSSKFRRPTSSRRSNSSRAKSPRLKFPNSVTESPYTSSRATNRRPTTARGRSTTRQRSRTTDFAVNQISSSFDGTITITHHIPTQTTITLVNGKNTEFKGITTDRISTEILGPNQYSTIRGKNGLPQLALTREEKKINPANGQMEVIQYVLNEMPTTSVIFTPTTIRGRKTSFSHVIPSTVYDVEVITSTVQPEIPTNAPLANILLSQLLLGNLNQAAPSINPLGAFGLPQQQPQLIAATPVTEFKTTSTTYVTTLTNGKPTILPVTFRGKEILTTIYDDNIQVITATELITETVVITPTASQLQQQQQQPQQQIANVNSLLLLLQQQQQQQLQQPNIQQLQLQPQLSVLDQQKILTPQEQLLLLDSSAVNFPQQPLHDEIDQNQLQKLNARENIDEFAPQTGITQPEQQSTSKPHRRKHKKHKNHHNQPSADNTFQESAVESSVVTLYVSGRRPGEFSTVLSTFYSDSSVHKREIGENNANVDIAESKVESTGIVSPTKLSKTIDDESAEDMYETNGSEKNEEFILAPEIYNAINIQTRNTINSTKKLQSNIYEINSQLEKGIENLRRKSKSTLQNDRFFIAKIGDGKDKCGESAFFRNYGLNSNLATRTMPNGIEVIIGFNNKDLYNSHVKDSTKLSPSALEDQLMSLVSEEEKQNESDQFNSAISKSSNHSETTSCLTSYTYQTPCSHSDEITMKIISDVAAQEKSPYNIQPTISSNVKLTNQPEIAFGVYLTTYTYMHTIHNQEQPLIQSSQLAVTNTINGPNDYTTYLQPSDEATPILETSPYNTNILVTKSNPYSEPDVFSNKNDFSSNTNLLAKIIITEALPVSSKFNQSFLETDLDSIKLFEHENSPGTNNEKPNQIHPTKDYLTLMYFTTLLNGRVSSGSIDSPVETDNFNLQSIGSLKENCTAFLLGGQSFEIPAAINTHTPNSSGSNAVQLKRKELPSFNELLAEFMDQIKLNLKNDSFGPANNGIRQSAQKFEDSHGSETNESGQFESNNHDSNITSMYLDTESIEPTAEKTGASPVQFQNNLENSLRSNLKYQSKVRQTNSTNFEYSEEKMGLSLKNTTKDISSPPKSRVMLPAYIPIQEHNYKNTMNYSYVKKHNSPISLLIEPPFFTKLVQLNENFSLTDQYTTPGEEIIGSKYKDSYNLISGRYTRNSPPIFPEANLHRAPKQEETIPLINGGIRISPGEIITANSDVIVGKPGVIGFRPRVSAQIAEVDSKNEINEQLKQKLKPISKYQNHQYDPMNPVKNINRLLAQKNLLLNYLPNSKAPTKITPDASDYNDKQYFHVPPVGSASGGDLYWKKAPNQTKNIMYPEITKIQYPPYLIPKKNYQKRVLNHHQPLPNRFNSQFDIHTLPRTPPQQSHDLENFKLKQKLNLGNYNVEIERIPEIYNTVLFNEDLKQQKLHYNTKKFVHNQPEVLVNIKPSEITDILIQNPELCNKKNIFKSTTDARDLLTSATQNQKNFHLNNKTENLHFPKNQKHFINLKTNTLNHQINVNVPPIQFKNYDDYDDPSEIGYLNNNNNTQPVRAQIQFDHILNDHYNDNIKAENIFQVKYPQQEITGQSIRYQKFNQYQGQQQSYENQPFHIPQSAMHAYPVQEQIQPQFSQPKNFSKLPVNLKAPPQFEYYINERPQKPIEPFIRMTTNKFFDITKNAESFNPYTKPLHSDKHIEKNRHIEVDPEGINFSFQKERNPSTIPLELFEDTNKNKELTRERCDPKLKVVYKNNANKNDDLHQGTNLLSATPSQEYLGKRVLSTKSSEISVATKLPNLVSQNLYPEIQRPHFKPEIPFQRSPGPTTNSPYSLSFQYLNNNFRLTRTAPNLFRQNYVTSAPDLNRPFVMEETVQSSTQKFDYQYFNQQKLMKESDKLKKPNTYRNIQNNTLRGTASDTKLPSQLVIRPNNPPHPILIPISENILDASSTRIPDSKETAAKHNSSTKFDLCDKLNLTKPLNNRVQIPLPTSKIENVLKPPKISEKYNTQFKFLQSQGELTTPATINSFLYYTNHSINIPSIDMTVPALPNDRKKFIIGLNPPPPPTAFSNAQQKGHKQKDQQASGTGLVDEFQQQQIIVRDNEILNETGSFKAAENFSTSMYNRITSIKMPQQKEKYLTITKNQPMMSTVISIGNNIPYQSNTIKSKIPEFIKDESLTTATISASKIIIPDTIVKQKITSVQEEPFKSNKIQHKPLQSIVIQRPELVVEPAYYINELDLTTFSVPTVDTSPQFSTTLYSTIPLKFTRTTSTTSPLKNKTKISRVNQRDFPNDLRQHRIKPQKYDIKVNDKIMNSKSNASSKISATILPTKIDPKNYSLINMKISMGAHIQNSIKLKSHINSIQRETKQTSNVILQTSKSGIHSQVIPNSAATKSIDQYSTRSNLRNHNYKSVTRTLSTKHIPRPSTVTETGVKATINNKTQANHIVMTLTSSLFETYTEVQPVNLIESTKVHDIASKFQTLENTAAFNNSSNFRNSKLDNFHSLLYETIEKFHNSLANTTIRPEVIEKESEFISEVDTTKKSNEDFNKLIAQYNGEQDVKKNHVGHLSQIDNNKVDVNESKTVQKASTNMPKNSVQIKIPEFNNDSIFVVITDSKSKDIPSLNSSAINSQQDINSISAAIGIDYNQYDDQDEVQGEISTLELPNRDEETQAKNDNHILLGGILIAASPNVVTAFDGPTSYKCKPECKSVKNEICIKMGTHMECACRPGFARMFLDRACKPTYTYTLRLPLHRSGNEILQFSDKLTTPGSQEFIKISKMSQDSLNRMVMQSDLRDIYHGVHIIGFERPNNNDGIIAEFYFQLSDKGDEEQLKNVFKKYLQSNNFSIGGTDLHTTGSGVNELQIFDYDECFDPKLHDCSENSDCQNLLGSYTCSCRDGFVDLSENFIYPGRICSIEQPGCEKCHYHGRCYSPQKNLNELQNSEQVLCKCFRWYAGSQCQLNLKLLLTSLLIFTAVILLILIVCIVLTCTRKRFHRRQNMALLASGINVIASGDSNKSRNLENSFSDVSSQNSLILLSHEPATGTKVQQKQFKKMDLKKKISLVSGTNQKNQLKKPKKITHISLKQQNHGSTDLGHRKLHNESDRSPTVMIPRAKYRPPALQDLKRKNAERLLTFLYTGGSFVHPSSPVQKPDQHIKRTFSTSSSKYGTVHATSTGALISAGFEVSANVSPIVLQEQKLDKGPQQIRKNTIPNLMLPDKEQNIVNGQINLQQQVIDIHPNYSDEGYEVQPRRNSFIDSVEDWFHTVKQQRQLLQRSDLTTFEARSFGESTVQPQTRVLIQNKTFHSQDKNLTNDDANTMAERDIGSTFLLPHTHLYKPDRGSDISGIDSF